VAVAPWHLLSKRILGQTNLVLNRRNRFNLALVDRLVSRIESVDPDQIICPGDLTTTALHAEFRMARRAFGDLMEKYPTFITPGNHDRYTFTAARLRRFEHYFNEQSATRWPHHRKLSDQLHLIGIDGTRPNLLLDRGEMGRQQLGDLKAMLADLPRESHVLMVTHYTVGVPELHGEEGWSHRLIDEKALVNALRESERRVLLVHGHVHRPWMWRLNDAPNVVAINAGSPTHVGPVMPQGQGLWELQFDGAQSDQPWRVTHHMPGPTGSWAEQTLVWPEQAGQSVAIP